MATGLPTTRDALLAVAPPRVSLLSAPGVLITDADFRIENGIAVERESAAVVLEAAGSSTSDVPYWWDCALTGGSAPATFFSTRMAGIKKIGTHPGKLTFDPFQVWVGYRCTAHDVAHDDGIGASVAGRRLLAKLEAATPAAVEREFWTGKIGDAAGLRGPALADIGTVTQVDGGIALGFVTALGELEQALADNANLVGRRMIHAQPRAVNAWRSRGLVELSPEGAFLRTALGTIVVPGTGYPGTGVGNTGAVSHGTTFAYGTGQVRVWLGAPDVRQVESSSIDREDNDVELRAERSVVIAWDPGAHVGARVSLCDEYCSASS